MAGDTLLAFTLTSLLIELTPGPNMTCLALLAARDGRRAGYLAVAGVALGLALLGISASAGLAALMVSSPALYAALRWGGIGYLLYLAWLAWVEPPGQEVESHDARYFVRGLMTNLLNPKAAVFYVAVLPTFTGQSDQALVDTLTLTFIYVLVATAIHGTIVALAGSLRPFLRNPLLMTLASRGFAVALAAVAVWFVWTTS